MIPSKWGEINTKIHNILDQYETGGFVDVQTLVDVLDTLNLLIDDIREDSHDNGILHL